MPLSRCRAAVAAGLFALAALAPQPAPAADEAAPTAYWVYFGTYTGNKAGDSKGIYRAKMDIKTGKLSEAELAFEMGSPSFLAVHPNGRFLYAVGEGGGKEGGPVVAFGLDRKTGKLTKLNEALSGGSGPCHVSVDPKGQHLAVANYGGGSTAVYKLNPDGRLGGGHNGFVQHKGSGPDAGRQKEPHAHCTFFYPNSEYVLTADLGADKVFVLSYGMDKGGLNLSAGGSDVVTPPGSGPRHFALAPDGKFGYVCGELDSTVNVIEFGWSKGNRVVQSLSTLPNPVKGNSTAECVLHPSGKFVYVSNRGHHSVAVFKVNDDRKLSAAGHVTGDIKTPRNFAVDPTGKWMLVASQDGGKVGVWEIDAATGAGKETGSTTAVSRPVCVKFVPVEE
ncbi:MAG: lactonase family protein [Gemmataceae bacterium]